MNTDKQNYLAIIANGLKRRFNIDWRNVTTQAAIEKHQSEGWDASKFVDFIAMKFNLTTVTA